MWKPNGPWAYSLSVARSIRHTWIVEGSRYKHRNGNPYLNLWGTDKKEAYKIFCNWANWKVIHVQLELTAQIKVFIPLEEKDSQTKFELLSKFSSYKLKTKKGYLLLVPHSSINDAFFRAISLLAPSQPLKVSEHLSQLLKEKINAV